MALIYLDNAATSFPKPAEVINEAMICAAQDCGNAGRGSHALALASAERIYRCRESVAALLGASDPTRVIFTMNTTYAINFLLKGTLRQGDHVLISDLEHNAVLRPLEKLKRERDISYDVFATQKNISGKKSTDICAEILSRVRANTRVLICTHQSNVCSFALPLAEIGALCQRLGILFFVDAAQSAGHLPIDMPSMHIDALCAPGHKGLLGLQGCGFCVLGERVHPDTLIEGGSGYLSLSPHMPDEFPERGEAGTLPTPVITSLGSGIAYLCHRGLACVTEHDKLLFHHLAEQLQELQGYRIILPEHSGSTLMFVRQDIPCDRIGAYLAEQGICVRTGYHCAALAHQTLGTDGGGIRVSFGPFNTTKDVDTLCRTLRRMEFCHDVNGG
ncbi:MAG: aminotransferase class V-fold PLP-dependent enzyme [Clostridia bacterium]|nr:aminotransferase class V-fold PLP-dependent enzyme [Clostridia bacterium]